MMALIGILIGVWLSLGVFSWFVMWDDSDQGYFEVILFFTPFNIFTLLVLIFVWIYRTIEIEIIKRIKNLIITRRKLKLQELRRDIDPYGEEDWTT